MPRPPNSLKVSRVALSSREAVWAFPFFTDILASERFKDEATLSERVGIETRTTQEEHVGHCVSYS